MSNQEINQVSYPFHNSSMAIISLIAGICGLTIFPFVGSIIAVVIGSLAKKEILNSQGSLSGENLAKAGVILGWIGIGLGIIGFCLLVGVIFLAFRNANFGVGLLPWL